MNGPGDIPLTHTSGTPDTRPCSIISIIPTLGMSSCRGRAEAFARRLSSKLRTLGSQTDDDQISPEGEPIINGNSTNTWMTAHNDGEHTVTDLQPLRQESDSFFDFDCELESPGSPVDECEYLRLIETASNTPHNSAAESGYACASAASSHSSNDVPFLDAVNSETAASGSANHAPQQHFPIKGNYVNVLEVNNENTKNARLFNGLTDGHDHDHHHECRDADDEDEGDQEERADAQKRQVNHHPSARQTDERQNNHQTELEQASSMQDTKPSTDTGPDIQKQSPIIDVTTSEPTARELTAKEMAKVQDQIIKELQKESEQYSTGSSSSSSSSSAVTVKAVSNESVASTDEVDCAASTRSEGSCAASATGHTLSPLVTHKITNGHSESGEEIVKIEVTEIRDSKPAQVEQLSENLTTTTTETTSGNSTEISPDNEATAASAEQPTCDVSTVENQKQQQEESQKELRRTATADTTDDEEDCRPQRVRRCSSLKTGKTPPGTPGRKKIVRFADVLGLDLADVKTFLDEIPTIPKSAFEDLEILESEPPIQLGPKSDKLLMPLFQQPGGLSTFLDLVREKQVSLENAAVTDHINQTITGSVRVRNLDFHKSVHIRYSIDNWRSYADLQANYAENSCDGFSDKFSFMLFCNTLQIGQRIEFAVRFQCKGQQFWDNNYGTNYCFQCLPTSSPATNPITPIVTTPHHTNVVGLLSPTVGEAWCSSFY